MAARVAHLEMRGQPIVFHGGLLLAQVAHASGKTLTVASSNGNQPTEARVDGLPVIVSVNAYIKPER